MPSDSTQRDVYKRQRWYRCTGMSDKGRFRRRRVGSCLLYTSSYDFTGLTDDELEKQLAVVDDRRIWVIAEALRRGVKYEHCLLYTSRCV